MSDKVATRAAYGKTLVALGREDERIVVLDADLSGSTTTAEFAREFPQRFFNMGIAEANMMGVAAGLAASGKIPFASTFAIFATGRAFEQVRQSIAYPAFPVKIAATHAGVSVGADGASHQSIEDVALMRVIPGMTVICPCDAVETAGAVIAAARHDGPVYLRLGRHPVPVVMPKNHVFTLGRAERLRQGSDVVLLASGLMVSVCLEAADLLAQQGMSAEVINVSTIKPLDKAAILDAAKRCRAVVTAEEHSVIGGLGSAVAALLAQKCPTPLEMVGIQDRFGQSGAVPPLLEEYGLTPGAVVAAAERVIQGRCMN